MLFFVGADSSLIEVIPARNRRVKFYLSQTFSGFGILRFTVSDSDLKVVIVISNSGVKHWKFQTGKWALQAWSRNLNVPFGAFQQKVLIAHLKTSKTRQNSVELHLGRRVRLPAIEESYFCEHTLFKAIEKKERVRAAFMIRKCLNTPLIQLRN